MDFSRNTGKIGLLNKNRQMGFFGCQKLTKQVLIKKNNFVISIIWRTFLGTV